MGVFDASRGEGSELSEQQSEPAPKLRNRRGMLLGAVAGIGATAAMLAGAQPAGAEGEAVEVGGTYTDATSVTAIANASGDAIQGVTTANGAAGLRGDDDSPAGGNAVYGTSTKGTGVQGQSGSGVGVWGDLTDASNTSPAVQGTTTGSGDGVFGQSASGNGVHGKTTVDGQAGVVGEDDSSGGGAGVSGSSVSGNAVAGYGGGDPGGGIYGPGNGVYGEASNIGYGVKGVSSFGTGVYGATQQGFAGVWGDAGDAQFGVYGSCAVGPWIGMPQSAVYGTDSSPSPGGYGVNGSSQFGTGVLGSTSSADGVGVAAQNPDGTALQVDGAAKFSRSGIATALGTPTSPLLEVTVTISGPDLTSKSMVFATIQGSGVTGVAIKGVAPDVGTKKFTIHFTAKLKTTMHIAWFVVG